MAYQVTDLMSDVIALVEQRWVGSEEIWNLANAMELESTERKISFSESCINWFGISQLMCLTMKSSDKT